MPRDLIWYCLRKRGVPKEYVCIIRDMYRDCTTSVATTVGEKEEMRQDKDYTKAGNLQKINMKEYDSDGKITAGISIQTLGNSLL